MATRPLVFLILAAIAVVFGLVPCKANNALSSSNTLFANEFLTTDNYLLIMQSDCNLVLYDSGKTIWMTNTSGVASGCRAIMQRDGNLVIYDNEGHLVWQTNTVGREGSYVLVLQSDRNVVIYGPGVWATNTQKRNVGYTVIPQSSTAAAQQVIMSVS